MAAVPSSSLRPLDLVPPELVLQIISHLNLADLASFARASRSCRNLMAESEEAVYRTAGFRLGLTDPQSAGSTAAVVAPAPPSEAQHQKDELSAIVKQQQSISTYYDGVESWKDFGQLRSTQALLDPSG